MNDNNCSEYLQLYNKRFFDIASNGCGSNCAYCFTKNPEREQTLLPDKIIYELCDKVKRIKGCADSIISLCPNTEPIKATASRKLVIEAIRQLSPHVKVIQIL